MTKTGNQEKQIREEPKKDEEWRKCPINFNHFAGCAQL